MTPTPKELVVKSVIKLGMPTTRELYDELSSYGRVILGLPSLRSKLNTLAYNKYGDGILVKISMRRFINRWIVRNAYASDPDYHFKCRSQLSRTATASDLADSLSILVACEIPPSESVSKIIIDEFNRVAPDMKSKIVLLANAFDPVNGTQKTREGLDKATALYSKLFESEITNRFITASNAALVETMLTCNELEKRCMELHGMIPEKAFTNSLISMSY